MKNKKYVEEWMSRARSNLEIARIIKKSPNILYEDMCFNCQQSVEKSLKAFLISLDQPFPPIHSISGLLELVRKIGIEIPKKVEDSVILTDYAVKKRYPGEYEPLTEKEYVKSLRLAENVFLWVEDQLGI
jgi:HEPN domain-containing protein